MPEVLDTPLTQAEPEIQTGSLSQNIDGSSDAPDSLKSVHFKLDVFEGPIDLLLHLIREQKIDIYDIPIVQITHQYMEYLGMMKELNLEIAGDFLVMAATLIHIKSRMLLPPGEEENEEPAEDPREELVQKLLEYQAYQESSLLLRKREDIWKNIFQRIATDKDDIEFEPEPVLFEANAYDLISAFQKLLEKAPELTLEITRETLTVKDKINYIIEQLEKEDGIKFEDLFGESYTRITLIVTFLALLEIVRLGLVKLYQESAFGQIWVLNPRLNNETEENEVNEIGETERSAV
jgi:segregation and condensation protein A